MVFKDQESGNGLAVWFQLKVPHQSTVKLLTGVQCSHGLSGAAGATSKLTHVAVDRRLHLISMGDRSPDGSWFSPKQVIQERGEHTAKVETTASFRTSSPMPHTVTSDRFSWSHRLTLVPCVKEPQKGITAGPLLACLQIQLRPFSPT